MGSGGAALPDGPAELPSAVAVLLEVLSVVYEAGVSASARTTSPMPACRRGGNVWPANLAGNTPLNTAAKLTAMGQTNTPVHGGCMAQAGVVAYRISDAQQANDADECLCTADKEATCLQTEVRLGTGTAGSHDVGVERPSP